MAAATLLATIAAGTAGCSGKTGPDVAPSVSTSSPAAPSISTPRTVAPTKAPKVVQPAQPAQLARSAPVRLQIAAIGVDSKLMRLGLNRDKSLQVPPGAFPAGWYTGMASPGELGTSIIVGHVDMNGPGVFYSLHTLKPGDKITVTRNDGSKPVFRVTRVDRFPKDPFPTALVYGSVGRPVLRLITCGGSFNTRTGHYEDNVVAFADLVAPTK